MECYRVEVPPGVHLTGYTVAGRRVPILPGEYHVHRLAPKARLRHALYALRFVGAYGPDGDIHVPLPEDTDIKRALPAGVTLAAEPGAWQEPSRL